MCKWMCITHTRAHAITHAHTHTHTRACARARSRAERQRGEGNSISLRVHQRATEEICRSCRETSCQFVCSAGRVLITANLSALCSALCHIPPPLPGSTARRAAGNTQGRESIGISRFYRNLTIQYIFPLSGPQFDFDTGVKMIPDKKLILVPVQRGAHSRISTPVPCGVSCLIDGTLVYNSALFIINNRITT